MTPTLECDTDGNESLEWQWLVYDDKWRVMARFEDGAAGGMATARRGYAERQ